jgi:hypothetical protein
MNHLTEDQFNEYLDNLLDERTRQNVEAHLSQCVDCRNQVEALKQVFADLDNMPEMPLTCDLTPAILAKLPEKEPARVWTRAFAAQWGVVVGALIWLGTQILPLVKIPQATLPKFPVIDLETLFTRLLTLRIQIPDFRFPSINYQLPQIRFQLPTLNSSTTFSLGFQPSTALMVALTISALLLWVVGNIILLRRGQEACG